MSVLTSEPVDLQRGKGLFHPSSSVRGCGLAAEVTCLANCGRTHAKAANNLRRTSQRLSSANSVCNCAVFLASPL